MGALSDTTGELGRLAVAHATKLDSQAVEKIYQVDLAVLYFMTMVRLNTFVHLYISMNDYFIKFQGK